MIRGIIIFLIVLFIASCNAPLPNPPRMIGCYIADDNVRIRVTGSHILYEEMKSSIEYDKKRIGWVIETTLSVGLNDNGHFYVYDDSTLKFWRILERNGQRLIFLVADSGDELYFRSTPCFDDN